MLKVLWQEHLVLLLYQGDQSSLKTQYSIYCLLLKVLAPNSGLVKCSLQLAPA